PSRAPPRDQCNDYEKDEAGVADDEPDSQPARTTRNIFSRVDPLPRKAHQDPRWKHKKADRPNEESPQGWSANGDQNGRADRAHEHGGTEHVQEERQVPAVGPDECDHHVPGFQIISARITRITMPLPQLSPSHTGSRRRAVSSALGASPSAASRSASSRVFFSRLPPIP